MDKDSIRVTTHYVDRKLLMLAPHARTYGRAVFRAYVLFLLLRYPQSKY